MSHETDRLSALVDGELDHDTRDRLLAHLTRCDRCRAVVEEERAVKAMLGGLPALEPPLALGASLVGLGRPEPAVPVRRRFRTARGAAQQALADAAMAAGRALPEAASADPLLAVPVTPASRPRSVGRQAARAAHRRRVRYGMVGGLSAIGTVFAVALTSGGVPARQEPGVTPQLQPYERRQASVGDLSRPDPRVIGASFERVSLMPPTGR